MIQSYKDLDVFKLSYALANDIFHLTRGFPKEEVYSLTSQIVRSSRSISSNIAEGWAKRVYENKFKLHLIDALGSNTETVNWICFAFDCGYIEKSTKLAFKEKISQIGKMLTKLHQNWRTHKSSSSSVQPQASNI